MTLTTEFLLQSKRFLIGFPNNRNFRFFNLAFLVFICTSINVFGQNPLPPTDSYVNFDSNSGLLFVEISDSTDISSIEVGLGSKGSNSDIFSHEYVFDQTLGLPSGLTFSRSNLNVFLGLGFLIVPPAFNVQVRIKNSNGNWSSWYQYVSN